MRRSSLLMVFVFLVGAMSVSAQVGDIAPATASADLSVSVTDSPDPVLYEQVVTYVISVSNAGPDMVPGLVTSHSFGDCFSRGREQAAVTPTSEFVEFVSGGGSNWSCSFVEGLQCTYNVPLASGATAPPLVIRLQAPYTNFGTCMYLTTDVSDSSFTSIDPNTENNFFEELTTVENPCPPRVINANPAEGSEGVPVSGTLSWQVYGQADYFDVYLGLAGGNCSTLLGRTTSTSIDYEGLDYDSEYEWKIVPFAERCSFTELPQKVDVNREPIGPICMKFRTESNPIVCPTGEPTLLAPSGTVTGTKVRFEWTAVEGAIAYNVLLRTPGNNFDLLATVRGGATFFETTLRERDGYQWQVEALFTEPCRPTVSRILGFAVQAAPPPPPPCSVAPPQVQNPSLVGESTTGEFYEFSWDKLDVEGISRYEVWESPFERMDDFPGDISKFFVPTPPYRTKKDSVDPTPYFYKVRAICNDKVGEFSKQVRVVIIPKQNPNRDDFQLTTQFGNKTSLTQDIFIEGPPNAKGTFDTSYTAIPSVPWITVSPATGTVPPTGTTLAAAVNPGNLPVGTSTGQITVNYGNGAPPTSTTIQMTLASPITPNAKGVPPANALLIPAVANVQGSNSIWQSDIRMTNIFGQLLKYQLTFTPSGTAITADSKTTTFDVASGQTVALDDIVNNLYGLGTLKDGANGVLEIRPLNHSGKEDTSRSDDVRLNLSTVASSRTYNIGEFGSVGQFIGAVPFSRFVGKTLTSGQPARSSIQNISNNSIYKTNLGIVEGAGEAAVVQVTVFDASGATLKQFNVEMKPGEHKQLNNVLTENGVTVDDGRIELRVTSDTGKITGYASVVDSRTRDPLLVPSVELSEVVSNRYVLPGVSDITNERNNWRSDIRIFNPAPTPVSATLTLYATDGTVATKQITVEGNRILVLNNVVETQFGKKNVGGAVHVTTASATTLIVTGRTYDQRPEGTLGQFVSAVTPADGTGKNDRPLQILQVEQSDRFRTNVGLAEMTGQSAVVEIIAIVPDSIAAPFITVQMNPNEFKQLNSVLATMGISKAFNGRLQIRVLDGNGKVTAYGSTVDNESQDPTLIPAI